MRRHSAPGVLKAQCDQRIATRRHEEQRSGLATPRHPRPTVSDTDHYGLDGWAGRRGRGAGHFLQLCKRTATREATALEPGAPLEAAEERSRGREFAEDCRAVSLSIE